MFKVTVAFLASSVVGQVFTGGYCAALETHCFETFGINATDCEDVFSKISGSNQIPNGLITDEDTNTLGCRMKYMIQAPFNMTKDACRYAGPTGGGRCGPVLDSVCEVAFGACGTEPESPYPDSQSCKTDLADLSNQWGYTQGSLSSGENSLECRAYQAMASKAVGQVGLCANLNFTSTGCNGRVVPNPSYYCETLQYNCNGTNLTQFAQEAQCNIIAAGYTTSGSDSAEGANLGSSLGCRAYHAQAALSNPGVHCQHAGPSGGGVCGTYGQAWASMAKAFPCNDTSVYQFTIAMNSTLNSVVPTGGAPYSTNLDVSGNTQACRIYHLGVASTDLTHCGHGSLTGNNSCGSIVGNLCDMIGTICSWGNNATYQYTGRAACMTALNNTAMGIPGAAAGDSIACRYYHVGVAGSYRPGGIQSAANDSMTQMLAHCSHVIAKPVAGCAAPTPAPTTAKPNMMTNGASALSLSSVVVLAIASVYTL